MNEFSIYQKRPCVLVNDSGLYFDKIIAERPKRIETLEYPTYEYLVENINLLKASENVILLYSTQKREIEFLLAYFPTGRLKVSISKIISTFLPNANRYSEKEVLELADKTQRYQWLGLFVFERLHKKLSLNPSYLFTLNPKDIWECYDLKNIDLPKTRKYANSDEQFSCIIFLELATAELLGEETTRSRAVKKLLSYPVCEEIPKKELYMPNDLFEALMQAGDIFQPKEGFVARL